LTLIEGSFAVRMKSQCLFRGDHTPTQVKYTKLLHCVTRCREPDRVVSSLISLTVTFGQLFGLLTSWEEMVAEFVRSEDISAKVRDYKAAPRSDILQTT